MNSKRLILVATLTCASASYAQSTVTIYGALDAYVGRFSATGRPSDTVLGSGFNPGVLGFTGTEDLGGGLKAGFRLEGQPNVNNGTFGQGGKFFGRQALVFLSGDWGRLDAGRLHTAGRAFSVKYSATGWLTPDPMGQLAFAMGAGISPAMNVDTVGGRLSNAVSYTSPRFSGLSFSALQSTSDGLFSAGFAKMTIAGVSYGAGPFTADAVVSRIPEIAGNQIKQLDYQFGATYDFKVVKVLAAYQAKKGSAIAALGSVTPLAGTEATDRFVVIGAQVPFPSGMLGLSVGKMSLAGAHRGLRPANVSAPFSSVMDDATAWAVAYTHYLSKRTSLFAAYGSLDNSGVGTASLSPALRPTPGGSSSVVASGVRHTF